MAELSGSQRQYIRRRARYHEIDPSEMAGELNIIPYLDICVNLVMFLLMTIASVAFFSEIASHLPEYKRGARGAASADEPSLNLSVTLTETGAIVTGSNGKLAPGCTSTVTGRVVTVPKKGNQFDWEGLTACVAQVKKEFPDETKVIVSADPLIEYQDVVAAMDSVRNKGADELFPDVLLSGGIK